MKQSRTILITIAVLLFGILIARAFKINNQVYHDVPATEKPVSQSADATTEPMPALGNASVKPPLDTFSDALFAPKETIQYTIDYDSGEPDHNAHGVFWSSDDPEKKVAFFSQQGTLLSFPNGDFYCDDVASFPKTLTTGCVPGTKASSFGADGSPLTVASGWKLVSGDPNESCGSPVYTGSVQVRGRLVWDYFYVARQWMFEVIPKDQKKIFRSGYTGKFELLNATPELERQLASTTLDKPVTIVLKGLTYYCEGAPMVSIAPLTQE